MFAHRPEMESRRAQEQRSNEISTQRVERHRRARLRVDHQLLPQVVGTERAVGDARISRSSRFLGPEVTSMEGVTYPFRNRSTALSRFFASIEWPVSLRSDRVPLRTVFRQGPTAARHFKPKGVPR